MLQFFDFDFSQRSRLRSKKFSSIRSRYVRVLSFSHRVNFPKLLKASSKLHLIPGPVPFREGKNRIFLCFSNIMLITFKNFYRSCTGGVNGTRDSGTGKERWKGAGKGRSWGALEVTPKLARIAAFILSLFYEYLLLDCEILTPTQAHVSVEAKSC